MRDYPTIAAVDLGSNSFHLVVAREVDGRLQILHKRKKRVYLAAGLDKRLNLDEAAMARAMDTLSQFATTLHGFPTESVQVVATYTLRNCKNLTEFLASQKAYFLTLLMLFLGRKKLDLFIKALPTTSTIAITA